MNNQFLFLVFTLLAARITAKLIDLSHNHGPNTLMSPHVPHFNRSTIFSGDYLPGVYVEGGQYFSGEHGGTHMDAPAHFQKDGQRLHEVPLENTIAEGVMIDCSEEAAKNKSYLVPIQKLLDWEKKHGQIPKDAAVIFNFGWSSKFNTPSLYLGSDSGEQFSYIFPAVSAEAGLWLYDYRYIKIIGSDTYTPDPFSLNGKKITSFPIHQRYLPNNRLIIENLYGTGRLPPTGFRFHASPVKYVGATGSQVRAFAMTHDNDARFNIASHKIYDNSMFVILCMLGLVMSF
uniref:Kynurenine formamidase n=1 Tax=Arion vulgaris TaxID=1028688 RepID=A0A0B7AIB0_9EUPU